jgi:hypothetical protein
MTISGILSGVTSPYSAGFALARIAARLQVTPPASVSGGAPSSAQPPDQVELSAAALGEAQLTEEEQAKVEELKQRDIEVRRHEAAHEAAAGGYAIGAPQYEYDTGPDDRRYVVNGEVNIDTSPVADDPDATIRKMETVRSAALAPADPSAQDLRVAAAASAAIQQAEAERTEEATTQAPASAQGAHGAAPLLQMPQRSAREATSLSYGPRPAANARPAQFLDIRA